MLSAHTKKHPIDMPHPIDKPHPTDKPHPIDKPHPTYRSKAEVETSRMTNIGKGHHAFEDWLAVMETESAHCLLNDFAGSFT